MDHLGAIERPTAGVTSGTALADHDDGVYELPALAMWDHYDPSILVHPPMGQMTQLSAGLDR